jgi:hypothetical protein
MQPGSEYFLDFLLAQDWESERLTRPDGRQSGKRSTWLLFLLNEEKWAVCGAQ